MTKRTARRFFGSVSTLALGATLITTNFAAADEGGVGFWVTGFASSLAATYRPPRGLRSQSIAVLNFPRAAPEPDPYHWRWRDFLPGRASCGIYLMSRVRKSERAASRGKKESRAMSTDPLVRYLQSPSPSHFVSLVEETAPRVLGAAYRVLRRAAHVRSPD